MVLKPLEATAEIRLLKGRVQFRDASGKPVLGEEARWRFTATSSGGKPFFATEQQFNRGTHEGFHGLGQHQNRQMNYNG